MYVYKSNYVYYPSWLWHWLTLAFSAGRQGLKMENNIQYLKAMCHKLGNTHTENKQTV